MKTLFLKNPSGSLHFWLSFLCNLVTSVRRFPREHKWLASQSRVTHLGNSAMLVSNVLQSGIKLHWLLQTISKPPLPPSEFIIKISIGLPHRTLWQPWGLLFLRIHREPEAPQFCFRHSTCGLLGSGYAIINVYM